MNLVVVSVLMSMMGSGAGFPVDPDARIVRRADVADAEYVALGSRFPGVVPIGRLGDAALIAPRWLLTAAHVARGVQRSGLATVRVGGREIALSAVHVHPDWRELGDHDIALLQLAEPAGDVPVLPVSRGARDAGRIATLVGHGAHGTGDDRSRREDGLRRGATSLVDSASAAWLFFSFDAPPAGTPLEGAPGPGDSGGPALLEEDGRYVVAGVSSAGFDGTLGPATYGAVDVYTRVATHLPWIDSVMARPTAVIPGDAATGDPSIPDTPQGRRFAAFVDAIGSDSSVAVFVREHFDEREFAARPALVPNLSRLARRLRAATLTDVSAQGDEMTGRFLLPDGPVTLGFVYAPTAPFRILDWRVYD